MFIQQAFIHQQKRIRLGIAIVVALLSAAAANAEPQACSNGEDTAGAVYSVKGKQVNLRNGPGKTYKRVRSETDELVTLDDGYIVRENCREGSWSQISLLSPDWLRKSHRGWVHSRYLVR